MLSPLDNWITCARLDLLTTLSINIIISCITAKINRQNNSNNLIICSSMLYLFFMEETRVWCALYIRDRRRRRYFFSFSFSFALHSGYSVFVYGCRYRREILNRYRFTTTSGCIRLNFFFIFLEPRTVYLYCVCSAHAILDSRAIATAITEDVILARLPPSLSKDKDVTLYRFALGRAISNIVKFNKYVFKSEYCERFSINCQYAIGNLHTC